MSKDGGPAFPHMIRQINEDTVQRMTEGGMSLRDYFAAAALQGLLAHGNYESVEANAYMYADAMLAERDK